MASPQSPVTITYLEMLRPSDLNVRPLPEGARIVRVLPPDPQFNRRMYRDVGRGWDWTEKLDWSPARWKAYASRHVLETWTGLLDEEVFGYFELERQTRGEVKIQYFGLLPEYIGRGLGGPLLSAAVAQAWSIPDTRRVWVHTCNRDHPAALPNYLSRGFQIYRTREV